MNENYFAVFAKWLRACMGLKGTTHDTQDSSCYLLGWWSEWGRGQLDQWRAAEVKKWHSVSCFSPGFRHFVYSHKSCSSAERSERDEYLENGVTKKSQMTSRPVSSSAMPDMMTSATSDKHGKSASYGDF